jgi:putative oxidoreductase
MTPQVDRFRRGRAVAAAAVAARILLGMWLVYMGGAKILRPEDFLKLVHQYPLVGTVPWENLAAAILPWFEVFCGVLLVSGIAARGAALVSAGLLLAFTALVLARALALHAAGGGPFCGIRFDCGCGGGEIAICRKLLENVLLFVMAAVVVAVPPGRIGKG